MNDRIESVLNGEIPRSSLSRDEEAELRQIEGAITAATAGLKSTMAPDFVGSVMSSLPRESRPRAGAAGAVATVLAWLWRPRNVSLRPAHGLVLAAGVVLLFAVRPQAGGEMELAEATAPATVYVQFRLEQSGASRVRVTGSFNGWDPRHELHQVAPGSWSALIALEPGVHDYLFIVDDEQWLSDPLATVVDDGFGGVNSRLYLALPETSS